jgi:hypothetical protein
MPMFLLIVFKIHVPCPLSSETSCNALFLFYSPHFFSVHRSFQNTVPTRMKAKVLANQHHILPHVSVFLNKIYDMVTTASTIIIVIQSLLRAYLMIKKNTQNTITARGKSSQCHAKWPFAAGVVLNTIFDHGFTIVNNNIRKIAYAKRRYVILVVSLTHNMEKTGCNNIISNPTIDNDLLLKLFDHIKYSKSCINMNDCRKSSPGRRITLLA